MIYSFYLLSQKEKRRKKEGNDPFFSLQNERKMEENMRAFKVISDAKKTSFHLSMKQGLFNFYYSKYLISRIKIFTSDGINQICENNKCSCKNGLACLG